MADAQNAVDVIHKFFASQERARLEQGAIASVADFAQGMRAEMERQSSGIQERLLDLGRACVEGSNKANSQIVHWRQMQLTEPAKHDQRMKDLYQQSRLEAPPRVSYGRVNKEDAGVFVCCYYYYYLFLLFVLVVRLCLLLLLLLFVCLFVVVTCQKCSEIYQRYFLFFF